MLDAEPAKLTKTGKVTITDGQIAIEGFNASNATCRDVVALAALWAIGELQRELMLTLEKPGGSRKMWLAGNYSDDMLPPVREGLGEDEMPWDRIDALTKQRDELRARIPDVPKRERECKTLEDWRCRAMYFESEWSGCSHGFNKRVGELLAKLAALKQAAQAVIDRWHTPLWKDVPATAEYIQKLETAVAKTKGEPNG